MEAVILLWIIFAAIVGAWSRSKGGSFIAGFMFSVLLSPLIAGLIVAFRNPDNLEIEKRKITSGNMRKCPTCAELIKFEALKCRFCGQDLSTSEHESGITFDGKYYTVGQLKFSSLKHAREQAQKNQTARSKADA